MQQYPAHSLSAVAANACTTLNISGVSASSSYSSFVPSNAIDGSLKTRWTAFGSGSWIEVNLPVSENICSVSTAWYRGDLIKYNFEIQLSNDGSTWTTVYSGTSSGNTRSLESYAIPNISAKTVKIVVFGNSVNNAASISEISLSGYSYSMGAPSVIITSPAQSAVVSSPIVNLTGSASDGTTVGGIRTVEVSLDNGTYFSATQISGSGWSSWTASVNVGTSGQHTVTARATDQSGNQATSSVSITVQSALYDDFSQGTYTLSDGQTSPNSKWHDEFNGYGSAGVTTDSTGKQVFFEQPETASGSSTHAVLVLSTKNFGTSYKVSLDIRTDKQLKASPNTWEVAWVMFNYVDSWHHYYFTLKTNGYELGKKDNNLQLDQQVFLATGASPAVTLSKWQHVDIQVQGNHITVWVNSAKVADYTDSAMSSAFSNGGSLGLYDEDSAVSFDNVYIGPAQ